MPSGRQCKFLHQESPAAYKRTFLVYSHSLHFHSDRSDPHHAHAWVQASSLAFLEYHLRGVLANDSSAISTLRCLKLYLERLGCNHLDTDTMHSVAGSAFKLVSALAANTLVALTHLPIRNIQVYLHKCSLSVLPTSLLMLPSQPRNRCEMPSECRVR